MIVKIKHRISLGRHALFLLICMNAFIVSAWAESTIETTAAPAEKSSTASIQFEDMELLIKLLPIDQRDAVLADQKVFESLAAQEVQERSVLSAARASGLGDDPLVKRLTQRGAERVLGDVYLNEVIRNNLPKDFPSDQQMRDYYESNKDKFQTPERVHLWQIYLPIAKGATPDEIEALNKRANALVIDLRRGRKDFEAAASEESQHVTSRLNGGYLGLLRIEDLLPEVRAAVKVMTEGQISHPVRSETGFHIVKRGATVPAEVLKFEEAQSDVRQLLIRGAIEQTRQAVLKKILESYPVAIDTKNLAEWRERLKAASQKDVASKETNTTSQNSNPR